MKKMIGILACLTVFMSLTIGLQSFMNPMPTPPPAPDFTIIEILDIPEDLYAVYINVSGPWYEDHTYTVFCANVTEYSYQNWTCAESIKYR